MTESKGFLGKLELKNCKFPLVSGVINVSPDSFYKGSVKTRKEELTNTAKEMLEQGARIIDLGAQSTRPRSLYGGPDESGVIQELERIKNSLPLVLDLASSFDAEVTVDTYQPLVADYALQKGASGINDVTGFKHSAKVADLVSQYGVSAIVMASNELPGDITSARDALKALKDSIRIGLDAGIPKERIIIDPGFGGWQGRPFEIDIQIFREFEAYQSLEHAIYIAVSRKSTVGIPTGRKDPFDRLPGTIALTTLLVEKGVSIVRTHDVAPTIDLINIVNTFIGDL